MALRVAVWSGPRSISTALMRSWGNRSDTFVCDEPLYGHYLLENGFDHPGREEVLEHHETDWRKVVARLTGPVPEGKAVFYQKHMAHHLLAEIDREWVYGLDNVFLIREPREMLTSLLKVLPEAGLADTGLPQQLELFREIETRTGAAPPVLEAKDVLGDPRRLLELLCGRLGLPFEERMLTWPPGRRETDGVWAPYWYANVEASTSFVPYRPKPDRVPAGKLELLQRCQEIYDELYAQRLR